MKPPLVGLLTLFACSLLIWKWCGDSPDAMPMDNSLGGPVEELMRTEGDSQNENPVLTHVRENASSDKLSEEVFSKRKRVVIRFVDSFGFPFAEDEKVRQESETEEAYIQVDVRSHSGLHVFEFELPQEGDSWRPIVNYRLRLKARGRLEASIDLGLLNGTLESPSMVPLFLKSIWDNSLSGRVVDQFGDPIEYAEIQLVEDLEGDNSYVTEHTLSSNAGGFWISYFELGPNPRLLIFARGYLRQEIPFSSAKTPFEVVLLKGEALYGNVLMPRGVEGGRVVFRSGDESHVTDIKLDGSFQIFGISDRAWSIHVLRNGIYFDVYQGNNPWLDSMEFDLRPMSKVISFYVIDETEEPVVGGKLVVLDEHRGGINLHNDRLFLVPKEASTGLILHENYRDREVDLLPGKQRVRLASRIPVQLRIVVPAWLEREIDFSIHCLEVDPANLSPRYIEFGLSRGVYSGKVPHLGEYSLTASFIHRGAPEHRRSFKLFLTPSAGTNHIQVDGEGFASFEVYPDPDWLRWAQAFFEEK